MQSLNLNDKKDLDLVCEAIYCADNDKIVTVLETVALMLEEQFDYNPPNKDQQAVIDKAKDLALLVDKYFSY